MKSKSHIFMANLLREAILPDGKVTIDGYTYQIPKETVEVLSDYPNYYRAGAVGPDFFPDMFFGQTQIHPSESGRVLERMRTVLARYNKCSKDYYPAYAFYLGYLTHYATDLFGHEDVNHYALGVFPAIGDMIFKLISIGQSNEGFADLSIIVRHIMVESYMDKKVPEDEVLDIEVPFDYVRKCFCTVDAYEWMKEKELLGGTVLQFNVLPYLLEEYKDAVYKQGTIRSIEKREEYINGWLNLWSTFTKLDIEKGMMDAFQACEEPFINLILNYVLAVFDMEQGSIDFIRKALSVLGFINDMINTILTAGLNKAVGAASDAIGGLIKKLLLGWLFKGIVKSLGGTEEERKDLEACEKFLKDRYKNPKLVLDTDVFCKLHNKKSAKLSIEDEKFNKYCKEHNITIGQAKFSEYLDYKWKNYGKVRKIEDQKYIEFKRCLKMGILCMLGSNNLNELFYNITNKNEYLFNGISREYGVYHICVDVRVSDKNYSGTDDNVYIDIGNDNKMQRYKLDHGGVNDFENSDQRTYEIYLTQFLPFSEITRVRLFKEDDDDLYLSRTYVKDMDTGILIAKGGNMDFTPKKHYHELSITNNLDSIAKDISKNGNDYISGVYVVFKGDSSTVNRTLNLIAYGKNNSPIPGFNIPMILELGGNIITRIMPNDMGVLYVPFYVKLSEVEKIAISIDGNQSLRDVFVYNATDFRLLCKADEISPNETNYLNLQLYQFPTEGVSYKSDSFAVIIKTAESAFSGTNDDISMVIHMKDKKEYSANLNIYAYDDFEAGDIDVYKFLVLEDIDVSQIREFTLHKSCNSDIGDWTVDFVAVVDLKNATPIFYQKFPGPTVMEGDGVLKITDGYWKRMNTR